MQVLLTRNLTVHDDMIQQIDLPICPRSSCCFMIQSISFSSEFLRLQSARLGGGGEAEAQRDGGGGEAGPQGGGVGTRGDEELRGEKVSNAECGLRRPTVAASDLEPRPLSLKGEDDLSDLARLGEDDFSRYFKIPASKTIIHMFSLS